MSDFDVLLNKQKIADRVREMGKEITANYAGQEVQAVAVLKGSFIFLADLIRTIDVPVQVHFLGVSSYQGTNTTGQVQITQDLNAPMDGKHILLVEDIVDTGLTLEYLLENLRARKPATLKVAALLDKPDRRKVGVEADYLGFKIPDEFVVGYGLDYNGLYRNLDHVAIYTE